jgi:hypothetical protein
VKRLACLLVLSALVATRPGMAQDSVFHRAPFAVKYGKWLLLAGAALMSVEAAQTHNKADDAFNQLQDYCFEDTSRCARGSNGAYVDPISENYYQTSVHYDNQTRAWLFGGEAALLGSAALFVWELTRPSHPPKNIPFEPEFQVIGPQTRLGLRWSF